VRPEYEGLRVDPCIPRAWKGFTVTRVFRGDTYQISIRNPRRLCRGIARLVVDGKPLTGNVVAAFGDGAVHQVEGVLE
jgi:cellobiose phosphorylase